MDPPSSNTFKPEDLYHKQTDSQRPPFILLSSEVTMVHREDYRGEYTGLQSSPGDEDIEGQGTRVQEGSSSDSRPSQRISKPEPLRTTTSERVGHNGASSSLSVPSNEKFEPGSREWDNNHVQFATYPDNKLPTQPMGYPHSPNTSESKAYIPLPLRPYFWIPLIIALIGGAIALEVLLHVSNQRQGWAAATGATATSSVALHYAYTLPPVIVASLVVALWAWTDIEIKKIQPYVDLVHGDSPPHRSLLLDYTRDNNFLVWTYAAANKHYLVALATLMVLLTLSFQPLAAALLVVKNTWIQLPDATTTNLAQIGLNQNLQFNDLSSFLSGAGFAGASVMYDLPAPPFVQVPYTIAPFQLPTSLTTNGTAFVNTTALKTITGCQSVPVQMTSLPGSAWSNLATTNGCTFTFNVTNESEILFGSDIPHCDVPAPQQFSPAVFWFFSYVPTAIASATFCNPSFSLWEVNVGVDVRSGNVTSVAEIRPFTAASKFSSASANVTGTPLNGRAYNGIAFDLTNPDQFVLGRQNATRLQLPASVYQAALQTPQGYTGSFSNSTLSVLSDEVYGIYLALVAKEVYFLPDSEPINVAVKTFQQRVWLSAPAVHLLTTAFLILAFFATIVHILHRADRRLLRLTHEPGTIASAVSIGAKTGVGEVLAGRHAEKDLKSALADKRFRMNPETMQIIMDSEDGYDVPILEPQTPLGKRQSVLNMLQGGRMSKRFSMVRKGTPTSPQFPRSPQKSHNAEGQYA